MTDAEYIWAWVAYLCGAGMVLGIFWYWTSKLPWSELRHILRLILAILLLVPWYTDPGKDFLSPAWLVSLADVLLHGAKAFWRAGLILVVSVILVLLLSTAYFCFCWFRSRKKSA